MVQKYALKSVSQKKTKFILEIKFIFKKTLKKVNNDGGIQIFFNFA
jgi:hypothetical protein